MPSKALIVPLVAGIVAHAVLAVSIVFLHRSLEVDLIKIWVGPVPFISALAGFVASLCFFVGLDEKTLTQRDYIFLTFGMLAAAAGGMMLVYFLEYQTARLASGQALSRVLTFMDFLQISFSSSSIKMPHQETTEALQFSRMGFLLPTLECLAYIIGGSWIGFVSLRDK